MQLAFRDSYLRVPDFETYKKEHKESEENRYRELKDWQENADSKGWLLLLCIITSVAGFVTAITTVVLTHVKFS